MRVDFWFVETNKLERSVREIHGENTTTATTSTTSTHCRHNFVGEPAAAVRRAVVWWRPHRLRLTRAGTSAPPAPPRQRDAAVDGVGAPKATRPRALACRSTSPLACEASSPSMGRGAAHFGQRWPPNPRITARQTPAPWTADLKQLSARRSGTSNNDEAVEAAPSCRASGS